MRKARPEVQSVANCDQLTTSMLARDGKDSLFRMHTCPTKDISAPLRYNTIHSVLSMNPLVSCTLSGHCRDGHSGDFRCLQRTAKPSPKSPASATCRRSPNTSTVRLNGLAPLPGPMKQNPYSPVFGLRLRALRYIVLVAPIQLIIC